MLPWYVTWRSEPPIYSATTGRGSGRGADVLTGGGVMPPPWAYAHAHGLCAQLAAHWQL